MKLYVLNQNVPIKFLIANMRNNIQKVLKTQKIATMMPHPAMIISTTIGFVKLLSLPTDTSQEKVEPQSKFCATEKKP